MVEINKKFQQYYTASDSIVNYMLRLLEVESGLSYLEPSAGSGIFIDALNQVSDIRITGYDIDISAVEALQQKYKNKSHINIEYRDTLTETNDTIFYRIDHFDRIIGNPPYGAWQEYAKRTILKQLYPDYYVKETYTLFLKQCIHLLNPNGILVFIVPDTFLNLHVHTRLRKYILDETNIREIALFPSSFFPGIQFGYANLCIIKLQKKGTETTCTSNKILIRRNFKKVEELNQPSMGSVECIPQQNLYKNLDYALFTSSHSTNHINELINTTSLRIGDIANCVTGFYSGNDALFLKRAMENTQKVDKYPAISQDLIYTSTSIPLDGISSSICYIPIMKGGGIKFYKPTLWYMNWSKENVLLYKNSPKARYQNTKYYFKEGIGVPMISSSCISAALIEKRLFDQSIVGIFPKEEKLLYYLLGFFNSNICNEIIRTINPTTNNSANYIKKIPIIIPSDKLLDKFTNMVKNILCCRRLGKENHDLELYLNREICNLYQFPVTPNY